MKNIWQNIIVDIEETKVLCVKCKKPTTTKWEFGKKNFHTGEYIGKKLGICKTCDKIIQKENENK